MPRIRAENIEAHKLKTRREILEATHSLLEEIGSADISLGEVAHEAGIEYPLERINRVAARVPHLCKVSPSGRWHMEDIHRAGGVPAILAELAGYRAIKPEGGWSLLVDVVERGLTGAEAFTISALSGIHLPGHPDEVEEILGKRYAALESEGLVGRDEGTAERYLEINGVWEDHVRYAITAEEWDAADRD